MSHESPPRGRQALLTCTHTHACKYKSTTKKCLLLFVKFLVQYWLSSILPEPLLQQARWTSIVMAEPARRARRARRARNGGYDTALRISTEPLSDNLKCNICMGILRDPVTVNASVCGHTYCRYCINVHVRWVHVLVLPYWCERTPYV